MGLLSDILIKAITIPLSHALARNMNAAQNPASESVEERQARYKRESQAREVAREERERQAREVAREERERQARKVALTREIAKADEWLNLFISRKAVLGILLWLMHGFIVEWSWGPLHAVLNVVFITCAVLLLATIDKLRQG